jgi:hypothetical protein
MSQISFLYLSLPLLLVRGSPLPQTDLAAVATPTPDASLASAISSANDASPLVSLAVLPSDLDSLSLIARPTDLDSLSLLTPSAPIATSVSSAGAPSANSRASSSPSNSDNTPAAPYPGNSDIKVAYIIPVVVVGALLLAATAAGWYWGRRKKRRNNAALYRAYPYGDWDNEDDDYKKSWLKEKEAVDDERGWRWGASSHAGAAGGGYSAAADRVSESASSTAGLESRTGKKVRAKQMLAESRTRYSPEEIDRAPGGVRETGSLVDRAKRVYDSVGMAGRGAGRRLRRDKTLPSIPKHQDDQETILVDGGRVRPRGWGGRRGVRSGNNKIQAEEDEDEEEAAETKSTSSSNRVVVDLTPALGGKVSDSSDESSDSSVFDSAPSAVTRSDPPTSITSYDPHPPPTRAVAELKKATAPKATAAPLPPTTSVVVPSIQTNKPKVVKPASSRPSRNLPSSLQPGAQPRPSAPLSPPMNPELFYSSRIGVPMPDPSTSISSFSLTGLAALVFPGYAATEQQQQQTTASSTTEEPFGTYTNLPSKLATTAAAAGTGTGTGTVGASPAPSSSRRRGVVRTRGSSRDDLATSPSTEEDDDTPSEPSSAALTSRATLGGDDGVGIKSPVERQRDESQAFDRVGAIVKKSRVQRALAQPREVEDRRKKKGSEELVRRSRTTAGMRLQAEAEDRQQLRRSESTLR